MLHNLKTLDRPAGAVNRREILGWAAGLALCSVPGAVSALSKGARLNDSLKGYLTGLHDPVIVREGDTYHVFGSGGWNGKPGPTWRVSRDLAEWADNGSPFESIPAWAIKAIPTATSMWAPDICFVDGLFRLYYSVSTGGSMNSVTGFATTPTLDRSSPRYGWTDHGLVIQTFEGGIFNAIDSNFVIDRAGNHWLAFGSYWSGIKLIPLDRQTGKRPAGDDRMYSIAYRPAPAGGDNPVEGSFIFTHGAYYYLFASYDYCCKKEQSNYYVAVGRSKDIWGPYLGKDGRSMMDGYGTAIIVERPWASTRWRGPGHCGLMHDRDRDLVVYHAYDVEHDSAPTLRLAELSWTADEWPVALV
jgi:arabinan endo-1,5-alpha-L-arabinosidase